MEEGKFKEEGRRGLIVYLYYNRDGKKLHGYGDILYHSKKHRYVQLYVAESKWTRIKEKLRREPYVKEVKESLLQDLGHHFVGALREEQEKV